MKQDKIFFVANYDTAKTNDRLIESFNLCIYATSDCISEYSKIINEFKVTTSMANLLNEYSFFEICGPSDFTFTNLMKTSADKVAFCSTEDYSNMDISNELESYICVFVNGKELIKIGMNDEN